MTTTTNLTLTASITALLAADGWHRTWPAATNSMTDEYGNAAHIHEGEETVTVNFEYGIPGMVEMLHLDPNHGAHRIVVVISALASPPIV